MTTAFVLSGGGSLGAVQVGMLQALARRPGAPRPAERDVARYADRVDVVVLPPLCPLRISATDFRHAEELRRRARASSAAWLDGGAAGRAHPERVLGVHGHATGVSRSA